jgi:hypothetical protein
MDDQTTQFLAKIAKLESDNGRNTNHQLINKGLQQGQRAIGKYGLLNNTIQEVLQHKANEGSLTPELADLRGKDQDFVRNQFQKNPALEEQVASDLAARVLARQGGNELASAFAWNNGTNLSPDQITTQKLINSPYANKYENLMLKDYMPPTTNNPSALAQDAQDMPTPKYDINTLLQKVMVPDTTEQDLNLINRPTDEDQSELDQDPEDQKGSEFDSLKDLRAGSGRYYQF